MMLTKLLSREDCAKCGECCIFSRYDIWEQPALSADVRQKAEMLLPDAEFVAKGKESCLFRIRETDKYDLFLCPLLDTENGCMLDAEKPFECQIYPFQVTEINSHLAIILSMLCDVTAKKPISELVDFLKEGTAEKIFSYAQLHPDVIRPYDFMSPVLIWKHETPQNFNLEESNYVNSKL